MPFNSRLLAKTLFAGAIFCVSFIALPVTAQDSLEKYSLFTGAGKKISKAELKELALNRDVVFFGEHHDSEISHFLELELLQVLAQYHGKDSLVLGMEMFESDNQLILDEYLNDFISERSFKEECRLWPNYDSDYKPLVTFCKNNGIAVSATNIPRRYASAVYHNGITVLDSFTVIAKTYMSPLPLIVDTNEILYQEIMDMMGVDGGDNFIYAQAIKDATMAWFIARELIVGKKVLHVNGALHSAYGQGIVSYLKKYRQGVNVFTITCVSQKKIKKLKKENREKVDVIVCIEDPDTE